MKKLYIECQNYGIDTSQPLEKCIQELDKKMQEEKKEAFENAEAEKLEAMSDDEKAGTCGL